MIVIKKETVIGTYIPISVGLILALLTAVAIGMGAIVLRQSSSTSGELWRDLAQSQKPMLTAPATHVESKTPAYQNSVPHREIMPLVATSESIPLYWKVTPLVQVSPPIVKRRLGVAIQILEPAKQLSIFSTFSAFSTSSESSTPSFSSVVALNQMAFPFADARGFIVDSRVKRPTLTSDIHNLEPVDTLGKSIQVVPGHYLRLHWFNQLEGLKGEKVFHSWYYQNRLMSRVDINVKSQKYRASSYKTILPHQQGQWKVVTESLDEKILATRVFEVRL